MKEQVSDLVVERLDSRLAVRDRALNLDAFAEKVNDNVRELVSPLAEIQRQIQELTEKPPAAVTQEFDISSLQKGIVGTLSDLPHRMSAATDALASAQKQFITRAEQTDKDPSSLKAIRNVESIVSSFAVEQAKIVAQHQEFSDFCQDIIKHINALPEAMVEATKVLQNAHADFAARDTSQKDSEEIRRLMATNAELQVQLAKARGAHGQVRVEKETLSERVKVIEVERERLSSRLETLEDSISKKAAMKSS